MESASVPHRVRSPPRGDQAAGAWLRRILAPTAVVTLVGQTTEDAPSGPVGMLALKQSF